MRRMNHSVGLKKQAGFNLIELLLALGIIVILFLGVFVTYNMVRSQTESNSASKQVLSIRSGVKNLYAGKASYGVAVINPALITAGNLPQDVRVDVPTNGLFNQWNGAITVTGATNVFTLTYAAVPQDACVKVTSDTVASGWQSVTVNGTVVTNDPVAIAAACNAAANAIVWTSL